MYICFFSSVNFFSGNLDTVKNNQINKSKHLRNIKVAIDTLCYTTVEEEKLQKLIKKER